MKCKSTPPPYTPPPPLSHLALRIPTVKKKSHTIKTTAGSDIHFKIRCNYPAGGEREREGERHTEGEREKTIELESSTYIFMLT